MNLYMKLGLILAFGLMGGRVARRFNLPNVTGYLVGGLFLGPSFLNLIGPSEIPVINFVNEVCLSAIAFNIGGEFLISTVKRVGKDIFIIKIFEVLGVVSLVIAIMYFVVGQSFEFSLIVDSMSAATAPAGTLMVIQQYRAKGVMTDAILPVAALDDALGIMVFGLPLAAAKFNLGLVEGGKLAMLHALEKGMENLVSHINHLTKQDNATCSGVGAAGVLGYPLLGFMEATIKSGIQYILKVSNLEEKIKTYDVVITGEGKIDAQSFEEKGIRHVIDLCQKYHKPYVLLCGINELEDYDDPYCLGIYQLVDVAKDEQESMNQSKRILKRSILDGNMMD